MNDNKPILRYNANERSNHWLVAILFFLAGLSGLALFHPALFWLSNLFGGGPWTRILHPFLGVAMFVFSLAWWCASGGPASSPRMIASGCGGLTG